MQSTDNTNKSLNDDTLCSTFEGLFKIGKQHEEITMSTAWNYEKSLHQLTNFNSVKMDEYIHTENSQNQKQKLEGQKQQKKIKNYKNQQVNANQTQNLINQEKQSIISKRTQKLAKLKTLLPYYYTVSLPQSYKKLLTIAEKIDHYLIQKRRINFYMDNIFNIFRRLFLNDEMSQIWSNVKKIMFLQDDLYKINIDPMKNLALGIKFKKDVKIFKRKQVIRKTVVDYYIGVKNNQENSQKQQQYFDKIPEIIVQPTKTSKFYLQNIDLMPINAINSSKISKQLKIPKLKIQFVSSIKTALSKKQTEHQSLEMNASLRSCPEQANLNQLRYFCSSIQEIYSQKKVKNMYKANLIDCLRKKSKFELSRIFQLLKVILKEQLFLEVLIKPNLCQIFHIVPEEKEKLLEFYWIKNNNL